MMKLEKRDVYIKEFWSMSWFDRYVYSVVGFYSSIECKRICFNPLKWSITNLFVMLVFLVTVILIPFMSIYEAFWLKTRKMPESKDPMFKGGQDWRLKNKWVVKR